MKSNNAGLIKPLDMNYVSKPWGWELWICNTPLYCGKKLFIKQGHHLSFHNHKLKDEVLFLDSGKILFTHDMNGEAESIQMMVGYAFHVTPGITHQMVAIEDSMLLEFSTQHFDSDSYRVARDLIEAKQIDCRDM